MPRATQIHHLPGRYDLFGLQRATFQQCGGTHKDEVYEMYLQQSKLWWDSLVRDVGADAQGRVRYLLGSIRGGRCPFGRRPTLLSNLVRDHLIRM